MRIMLKTAGAPQADALMKSWNQKKNYALFSCFVLLLFFVGEDIHKEKEMQMRTKINFQSWLKNISKKLSTSPSHVRLSLDVWRKNCF